MRSNFLPFHVPCVGDEEVAEVVKVLRSGWLTTGPQVRAFEEAFARYIDVPHAVALNSCTAALHLALDSIGLAEGDEVLVPTMTFAATAEVVHYFKAHPVLVDCEPDTLNIDPLGVEKAITPRTRAIIAVHYAGHPCDLARILEISRLHQVKLIEDAAHALPASFNGRRVGNFGDLACFSFYATKTLCTGKGGMATTANSEYADNVRIMSLHGISKDAWRRYTAEGSWYYEISKPGFKYNMTDIAAAMGLVQLAKCDRMWKARKRIAELYCAGLRDIEDIVLPVERAEVEHSWHLYPIRLRLESLRVTRGQFIEMMRERNIGTSVHFIPLHLHPFYREQYRYSRQDFPNALSAYESLVSLPIYPSMSEGDVFDVIEVVRDLITSSRR